MKKILIKNAKAIVTCDEKDRVSYDADLLIEDKRIAAIGKNLDCIGAEIINAEKMYVYPGLVNTHHHMFQAFTRNISELEFNKGITLFDWLRYCYELWKKIDGDYAYYSALVSMVESLKYGCTTVFNQHYVFPAGKRSNLLDRQLEASQLLGIRYHAGRSGMTLTKKDGGLPPDELGETTDEFAKDCCRLIDKYHKAERFGLQRIVAAPCSPFSVSEETYLELTKLARARGINIHSHLAEDPEEIEFMINKYGKRSLAWAEDIGMIGKDVWYAHGNYFNKDEFKIIAETETGITHCPVPMMILGSDIINITSMLNQNIKLGLGTDGQGVQDGSSLLETLRLTYLVQCLLSQKQERVSAPTAYECLKIATVGGAKILGRDDIGSLEVNKAADMFLINVDQLEYAGALRDPASFLSKVGYNKPVELTIANGRIVYRNGRILGIDEEEVLRETNRVVNKLIS